MPSRNIIRYDTPDSYYHVYARGINKSKIFASPDDKEYFLYLLSRHLSVKPVKTKAGYKYPQFRGRIELLTYCIMDNHFHLLFYQKEQTTLAGLMQSIMSAYSAYFNRKHTRRGPVFESRYKSVPVDKDQYLLHVSRYIHLNPRNWKHYKYSSINHIRKGTEPEWLQTQKVLQLHSNRKSYLNFVAEYEQNSKILKQLEYQLADQ